MAQFDTGVDDAQVAAADGVGSETENDTQFTEEDNTPESISLAELLGDDDTEKVVDSGDDNPPEPSETKGGEEEKPADAPAGIDQSKAFAERLKREREKIRREFEQKYANDPDIIEAKARKMMEQFPDDIKSLEYAKHLVMKEMSQPQSEQPAEDTADTDAEQSQIEAWKQSLIDEEPLLQMELRDPEMTVARYARENPAFEAALKTGATPMQALAIKKALDPVIEQKVTAAKAGAQQEVLDKVKQSNSRAVKPVANATGGGKPKSMIDFIKTAPLDKLDELIAKAEREGKKLSLE